MSDQELTMQDKENIAEDTMASLGDPQEVVEESKTQEDDLPVGIKKRLGMQEKRHKKELRDMNARLEYLQQQLSVRDQQPAMNPYSGQEAQSGSEEERIFRTVQHVLRARDDEERRAKDAESKAYVDKHFRNLGSKLDNAATKYEDFDDVVRAEDAPYTEAMKQAALLIDNPDEVFYKLGKNRQELERISKLHPLDQAREMVKLSIALMGGMQGKQTSTHTPMGQIKSNPVKSKSLNENGSINELAKGGGYSIDEIRAQMKRGWK